MTSVVHGRPQWSLADLIDFETLLASGAAPDERDRTLFARDIRPGLPSGDELARRRLGLRHWLDIRRGRTDATAGTRWNQGAGLLRAALIGMMFLAGFGLAAGLCARSAQAVHVIVFFGLTLVVPWAIFLGLLLLRVVGVRQRAAIERVVGFIMHIADRIRPVETAIPASDTSAWLIDSGAARRGFANALGGLLQWGSVGFNAGLILAFAGSLMVFDVRFYWEATPHTETLVGTTVTYIAVPWAAFWPAAAPDRAAVKASRARYIDGVKRVPDSASVAGAWWRFLLMSLLVWGLLPRLLLVGVYRWRMCAALARLDFQAPRHRALWRALTAVERGPVAPAAADGALVLDVGGIGLSPDDLRGFLLRALRVNLQAQHRVAVLDDDAEAAADAALAAHPDHVVLLVEDWGLSPRQVQRLHTRIRAGVGEATPVTWVVLSLDDGLPVAPGRAHLARWEWFVDGLRDPATEIVSYESAA